MNHNINITDFLELINLFTEDNASIVDAWGDTGRLFIRGDENELMLRINEYSKEITISRINIKNQRKGYGTKILNFIKDYANKKGLEKIRIESVMSDEMQNFAKKHDFTNINDGFEINGYYLNWILLLKSNQITII